MKILKIALLFFMPIFISLGQNVKVLSIEKIDNINNENGYYPKFIGDSQILTTSSNYKGLYLFDLNNKSNSVINEDFGSGYDPKIINNNEIYYLSAKYVNGKKYSSLLKKNLITGNVETLQIDKRLLKIPDQNVNGELVFIENSQVKNSKNKNVLTKNIQNKIAVYSEDDNLKLINNDEIIDLSPLGKGVYLWTSISPDGNLITFSFGNKGSFICDLNGNILAQIEKAHFPKFSPDGKYLSYMIDSDNGTNYTSSDIYVYSLTSNLSYKITDTNDKIEMYAEWSSDGDKLVFNTIDGEIFIAKLQFED